MSQPPRSEEIPIPKPARRSHFEAIFDASPDAILLVGADGLIRDVNPRAEEMFRWPRDEMVGEPVEMLVPRALRDDHRRHRSAYSRHPASRPMGLGMELQAVSRDGVAFPVEISLGPSSDRYGELMVVCVVRGIAQSEVLRRVGAARVLTAETERTRIARELHDDIKQSLTAIQLHLAALEEMTFAADRAAEMVVGIQHDLDRCHDALDRVIRDLMPVELEGHTLEFALRVLCRRTEGDGFVVERDIRSVGDALNSEGRLAVFRVVQEALNNARRHSGAGCATVRCWRKDGLLCAEVSDYGAGFSPNSVEPHLSVGLASMRERSQILGGRLVVSSAPGAGTSVLLEVPVRSGPASTDDPE